MTDTWLPAASSMDATTTPLAEFYRATNHTEDEAFALCILHGKAGSLEQPRRVPHKAKT